ncbi:hypothetical protein B296_00058165 [Ensete ventricosum]|uniref:Uncharacterized protein n=1 Tax=Ensete ventricosum TaxID=4639 RepID=A0A426XFF4_ENSVE|nr:hypothetical protein B296_00058165 [Ensete ventricosum]
MVVGIDAGCCNLGDGKMVQLRLGSSERWRRLVRCRKGELSSNNTASASGERAGRRQLHRRFGAIATAGGEEELASDKCNRGSCGGGGESNWCNRGGRCCARPRATTTTNSSDVVGDRGERGAGRRRGEAGELLAEEVTTTTASAIDSIMSGACLSLERETCTDEERVAFGAEDVPQPTYILTRCQGNRCVVNHDEDLTTVDFDRGDTATAGAIDRSEGQREKPNAIVVVHEKDDLVQKDASVEE